MAKSLSVTASLHGATQLVLTHPRVAVPASMRTALVSPLSAGLEKPREPHPSYRLLKQETRDGCELFVIVGMAVLSKGWDLLKYIV